MMRLASFACLLLVGCSRGALITVPSTDDAYGRSQRWATEERAAHARYHREFECDPLTWGNAAPFLSQHPECNVGGR